LKALLEEGVKTLLSIPRYKAIIQCFRGKGRRKVILSWEKGRETPQTEDMVPIQNKHQLLWEDRETL
jgi:hypothetical protein